MREGRREVIQSVSYLHHPGLPERGTFMGAEGLIPYLVILLARNCVMQLAICLVKMHVF